MEIPTEQRSHLGHVLHRLTGWFAAVFPEAKQKLECLIPDIDPIMPPGSSSTTSAMAFCPKRDNHHPHFIPFSDLDLNHLPPRWHHQHVLQDIRDIGQHVVLLRVLKPSAKRSTKYGHCGSGFVTCERWRGVVVHTSRHVVMDPEEADNTQVVFSFDREKDTGVTCQGSSKHFRSVWSLDYTTFTLDLPLPDDLEEQLKVKGTAGEAEVKAFSWGSLFRPLCRQSRDTDDVLIISHPHGGAKKVSVGKMQWRHNMSVALYTATTCPGSCGAPVVRLSDYSKHNVTAGHFVHHGHDRHDKEAAPAIGSLRPPLTLPYFKALDEPWLRRAVAVLYEPVVFWTLWVIGAMEVNQSFLFQCLDSACYFLTFYGFFIGWGDVWTWTGLVTFVVLFFCEFILFAQKRGVCSALLLVVFLLYNISMHWVTWLAYVTVPRDYLYWWWLVPLWFGVLLLSRYLSLSGLFGIDLDRVRINCQL